MAKEFNALPTNHTCSLVPTSQGMHIVTCKWVFQTKQFVDGSIERRKACLVAKDFLQQFGIDFEETFSPVVKPTIVHMMLALVAFKHLLIQQYDV